MLVPSCSPRKQNSLATHLGHVEASNALASAVMLLVLLAVGTATSSSSVPSPRRLCRNKEWRTLCSVKVNLHALAPGARLKQTAAPRLSSMRRCCFLIHLSYLRITALGTALLQRLNFCSETGHCDPTAPCPALRLYHHQMRYSDETCDACQSPIAEHLCSFLRTVTWMA